MCELSRKEKWMTEVKRICEMSGLGRKEGDTTE